MKLFLRFLLFFALLSAGSFYLILGRYHQPYPTPLGPQLDDRVRTDYTANIEKKGAKVIVIGDSILMDGVDPAQFEQVLGQKSYFLAFPGSASAQWYLLLKNSILAANPRPTTVVILFRDTALTVPDFRVTGRYFQQIDENTRSNDPELVNRAYIWPMNPVERVIASYFPLYGDRTFLRGKIDTRLKYTLPARLYGCSARCVEVAIYDTFTSDNMNKAVLGVAVGEAEGYLYTFGNMNFNARVNNSFLPLLIDLARRNNIHLILVRARTRDSMDAQSQPFLLNSYIQRLEKYLKDQGVTYITFANDTRISSMDFKDGIHMNFAGRSIFTPLFAQAVRAQVDGTIGAKP